MTDTLKCQWPFLLILVVDRTPFPTEKSDNTCTLGSSSTIALETLRLSLSSLKFYLLVLPPYKSHGVKYETVR